VLRELLGFTPEQVRELAAGSAPGSA